MKVAKDFYCTQEKKSYRKGSEYKGDRKDLGDLLEKENKPASKRKTKELKKDKETK